MLQLEFPLSPKENITYDSTSICLTNEIL